MCQDQAASNSPELSSRHTIVCRAAQEAGAQPREYIDRKNEKAIFRTSVALCCLDETRRFLLWTLPPASVLHIPNLSEIASSVFPRYVTSKIGLVSSFVFFLFFFFSHTYKNRYKT